MCTTCVHRGQKKVLDPMKLELQAVYEPPDVDAKNLAGVLCTSSKCVNH